MTSSRPLVVDATSGLGTAESAELRALMAAAFGERFDDHDFAHALGGTHLVIRRERRIVAHAAVVGRRLYIDDQVLACGYVEAVATLPALQRQGLGHRVMVAAGEVIRDRFDVGALSTGSPAFYEKLGWRHWQGPAHVVVAGKWLRAADEDDAVMVLAVPGAPAWESSSAIAVDDRSGDAW